MPLDLSLAILHHVAVFSLLMLLAAELGLLLMGSRRQDRHLVELLSRLDLGYGLAAALVLAAGFARVFLGDKPSSFYLESPAFWAKMGAFLLVGLISVIPTVRFIRWRKALGTEAAALPPPAEFAKMRRLGWIQVSLVPVIVVFAALMARGVGL